MRKQGTSIDQMREVFATTLSKERPRRRRPNEPTEPASAQESKLERWKPLTASNFLGESADAVEADEVAALDETRMRKRSRVDNVLPEKIVSFFMGCGLFA
jgi:hypothetical protein